jgi:hypothetical protein
MPKLESPKNYESKTAFIKQFFQKMKVKNGSKPANYNEKVEKLMKVLKKNKVKSGMLSSEDSSEVEEYDYQDIP